MTALSQSTKRKLSLLQLADELGNVARACKIMGDHRDTFYEVRRAFQIGGVAAQLEDVGHRLRSALRTGVAVLRCPGRAGAGHPDDNGREFCGKPQSHPYELLLAIEDIEHRNTKVAFSGSRSCSSPPCKAE